ncbi:hypothetical protein ASPVEDRAFT_210439 [Aspergillus versicolor CBS 583.65]|uniref:BTB domain-containing protein n=1 Tax=Aspergillus versicolor CBS 583.65 TaxID=1036611 RepID=A0A1L9P372_ASPVE|nr:uncharacterized protein ASPVEDRAFT_210439 [Aspergillus versicolor CBS 583.65]OJI95946.1 hypothetical protein ASPVEDRAFT_210439 [Aspergillus versicolor CBS 583.65]
MRVSVPFQLPLWYLPPPEPRTDERMACFVSTDGSQPDTLIEAGGYIFAVHFSKIADLVQNLSRHAPNPLDHQDPALHRFRFVAKKDLANPSSRHLGIVDTNIANASPTGLDPPTQQEVHCLEMWLRAAYRLVVPIQSLENLRNLYDLAAQFSCPSWMGPYLDWLLPNIVCSEFWLDMRDPGLSLSYLKIAEDTKSRLLYHDALTMLSTEFDVYDSQKEDHFSMYLDSRTISLAKAVSQRRAKCVAEAKRRLGMIRSDLSWWLAQHRSKGECEVEIAVRELTVLRDMPVNCQSPATPKPMAEIVFLSDIIGVLNRFKAYWLQGLEGESVMNMVNNFCKFAKRMQRNGMKLDRYGKLFIITTELYEKDIDFILGPQTQRQYVAS